MTKVEQIKKAIQNAEQHNSKLVGDVLEVPSFCSIKIRHLLNNLGEISTNYLECGSHLGGHYCSVVYGNNLKRATAIDNYSEFNKSGETKATFLDNANKYTPEHTKWDQIEEDCFTVKDMKAKYDLYNYDALHTESAQQRAVTHFLSNLEDEFIMVVDDWQFPGVESGTRSGIKIANLEIVYEQSLVTKDGELPNDSWHNGYFVALLKKKK